MAPDGHLMAADVKESPSFEANAPKPLFQARLRQALSSIDLFSYDVSSDGQRFLINVDAGDATTP